MADESGNRASETEPLIGDVGAASQHEDASFLRNLILGTGIIAQIGLLVLGIVIWTAVFTTDLSLFSAHPLLNSLGLVLLFESTLILQPTHTPDQKHKGAIIHSILNGLAFLFYAAAFIVIVVNKFRHNGTHFESPHAILGLITYIGILLQALVGFAQFYTPGVFGSIEKAKSIYKYHRLSGYALQLLLLSTVIAATRTPFALGPLDLRTWQVSVGAALVVIGIFPRIKKEKLGFAPRQS